MKKNIVVFTQTLSLGGSERQAVYLANLLSEFHTVFLVVFYGNQIDDKYFKLVSDDVKIIRLSGKKLSGIFEFYLLLRRQKIEMLFSYLLLPNFIGGFIGGIAGVKYKIGGIRNAKIEKGKVWINRFLQNKVNNITIYNNFRGIEENKRLGFNTERAVVIPNFINNEEELIIREKKNTIKIITVARFVQQKNWHAALKVIQELSKLLSNNKFSLKYYAIGYGELENEIRDNIKKLGLSNIVEIVVKPQNLSEYYKDADIYLCTSLYEGLSNTVLEAMSFSLPVVATDVGDNNKIVENSKNGYLTCTDNVIEIVKYLSELALDYDKRMKYGENSYKILNDNFSYKKYRENYISFIERLNDKV